MTQLQSPAPLELRRYLAPIFLTTFIDLIGFSLIFPLIPQLTAYYTTQGQSDLVLQWMWQLTHQLMAWFSLSEVPPLMTGPGAETVIFGCLLGSLYSLLQFVCSPFWGKVSDQWGRRPVLLITTVGMLISYVLWIFSSSFTLLVVARILGGLSSGNLAVASAAIADVTPAEQRSKGMAIIGIAFALGFVFGPALGGLGHAWQQSQSSEYWFGLLPWLPWHPFTLTALMATVLATINVWFILAKFPETIHLPNRGTVWRTANLWTLLRPHQRPQLRRINYSYFLYIFIFAGMEFTLTFLTVERLSFSPKDNGFLFVYIGFMIALIQGGVVRRYGHRIGEEKLALIGLGLLIPALWLLSVTSGLGMLLLALAFLATGSALVVPSLTALVSLKTSSEEQGQALGHFRSLGALGRVLGPILASLLYWRLGSAMSYIIGGFLLVIPMVLLKQKIKSSSF